MIYVRVELWPFGQKEKARVIGEITVGNVGGTDELGDYEVEATDNRGTGFTRVIVGHDREQRPAVWEPRHAAADRALELGVGAGAFPLGRPPMPRQNRENGQSLSIPA